MLYVINPNNIIYNRDLDVTVYDDRTYYVVDTDDLAVEAVSGKNLKKLCDIIENIHETDEPCLGSHIILTDEWNNAMSLLGGKIKIEGKGKVVINGMKFLIAMESTGLLTVNNMPIVWYAAFSPDETGIAYMHMLSNHIFIMSTAYQMRVDNPMVVTVLIFDLNGELIGVIPDKRVSSKLSMESNSTLITKYKALGGRY